MAHRVLCRVRGVVCSFGLAGPRLFPPRFTRAVRKPQAAPPTLHLEIPAQCPASPSSPAHPSRARLCHSFSGRLAVVSSGAATGLTGRAYLVVFLPVVSPGQTWLSQARSSERSTSSPPPAPQPQLCFWGRCLLQWHPLPAILQGCDKARLPGGRAVGPAPGPAGRVCDGGRGGTAGESLPHLPPPLCFRCPYHPPSDRYTSLLG